MTMSSVLPMVVSRQELEQRDQDDPLRGLREAFDMPPDLLYMDGNSRTELGSEHRKSSAMSGD